MSKPPLMLGVSGLRGIVGHSLTPDSAARYAAVVGAWLAANARAHDHTGPVRVVVGRDGRAGGHAYHTAALAGLAGAGCEAIDLGVAMTPTVGVMAEELDAAGGLIITASHNPQQWNGLKALVRNPHRGARAHAPTADHAAQIVERFRNNESPAAEWDAIGGLFQETRGNEIHVARVTDAIEANVGPVDAIADRALTIAIDAVNASGVTPGAMLLEALGVAETLHLAADTSGLFPHEPEPTEANLRTLAVAVRESGADAGFAQDPDGDRLAIVDNNGRYIGEELTLALAAESLLDALGPRARGITLAANLSTSRLIDDIAEARGATVLRTPVGEANVVQAMLANDATIAGEGNGGVIWPEVTMIRDSLSAMALVLSLMARRAEPLSAIVEALPAYAIEKRKIDLPSRDAAAGSLDALARHHADATIDRQDGVRIDWPDRRAWLHVRPSNTEPILRLIAEAPDAEAAASILDEAQRTIAR